MVRKDTQLRGDLIKHFHSSAKGGHFGMDAIVKRLAVVFYWKGLRREVRQFVRECGVCQRCKADLAVSPGLLQPLPIQIGRAHV